MLSEPWAGGVWSRLESVLGTGLESIWNGFFIGESEFISHALCFPCETT